MSYATLMVHMRLGQPNTGLLNVTAELAERLHAGVVGVAVCQPLRIIYSDGYVPSDVLTQDQAQIEADLKAAEAEFRDTLTGKVPDIAWRSAVIYGSLSEQLAKEARCADLIITGVDPEASVFDTSRYVDLGDLVMRAGRPCLILPEAAKTLPLKHALIGWKDTTETRRAVCDAMPLLRLVGRVTVAEIAPEPDLPAARTRLQDVIGWLKRHGVEARALAVASTGDDAARLSGVMMEQGADLLVAGAYGHSRVREWALGGVTRDLLLHGGHCTLVSH